VLKGRLYEIDRIISRVISYAVITVVLAGLFAGLWWWQPLCSLLGHQLTSPSGSPISGRRRDCPARGISTVRDVPAYSGRRRAAQSMPRRMSS
jgi:hypothetical protein